MQRSRKLNYTWEGSAAQLDRLAKASAGADASWLRSLSIDESVRILEDLCRGIPELGVNPERDPLPVVLGRLWKHNG